MEILVPIVVIGVLFVVFTADSWSDRSSRPASPPRHRAKVVPIREPFDPKHAKPEKRQISLCGSAYVIDGDSIVINRTQVRLFGVDAPELDHPYGQKAKWAMVALCKGHKVRADIIHRDHYGRTVARCFLPDGRDLSAEMVKIGLAIDWPKYSGGKYTAFETHDARKKLWLAAARQKGHMFVWEQFEARQRGKVQ